MRRILLFIASAATFALLGACSVAPVRPPPTTPEVILVSIDGYRADYLARGENPVLEKLASEGVRARWLVPVFPTVTEPNHYTMLTGLYPDQNGIVDNDIFDQQIQPEKFDMTRYATTVNAHWWSDAMPLWVSVQRDGMRVGEVSWPGGLVRVDGLRPDLRLSGQRVASPDRETAGVLRWLSLAAGQRPRFFMLHYEPVDYAGHHYGPDSPEVDAALREVDSAIGRLVDGLKRDDLYADTDLVIVSDHGMAAVSPGHQIFLDDIIHRSAVELVTLGANAGIDPRRGLAGREAEMTLLEPHSHMRCWRRQDLPPRLHYGHNPRIPSILCLASPGWVITTHWATNHRNYVLRGIHGYDNAAPSMRAIFIAEGPSFRKGVVVPPFPIVDVYPLLAHILGVTPEHNDGNFAPVESLLRPAAP